MPSTISFAIYVYILALIVLFEICNFLIFFIIPSKVNKLYKDESLFISQFNRKILVTRGLFCISFVALFIVALFFMNQSSNKYIHFVGFVIFIIFNTLLISSRKKELSKSIYKCETENTTFERNTDYADTIVVNDKHIEMGDIMYNPNKSSKTNSSISNSSDNRSSKLLQNVQNRSIIPASISDSEILNKYNYLKNSYGIFCIEDDFRNMLKGQKVNEKIVFLDNNKLETKLSIIEYLAVLNFIVDGSFEAIKSNEKLIYWIHENFNLDKIKKGKLTSKNISDFKDSLKTEKKSNFR
ncbi:hypothetical protein [Flavobacterium ammonificans]|uniref:hypothetical protein n=1 Tax=Flavobacterium ammonificans TaxID=1751056 RepID=UPI001E5A9BA4|nr:hypothetical protein [Flavobacterium ammonificans]